MSAQELMGGTASATLLKNLEALRGHEEYAESIGHDTSMLYKQFSPGKPATASAVYDEEEEDEYGEYDDAYRSEPNPAHAEELTKEAIEKAEGGDAPGALDLFQQALDANPRSGRMWENLGVTQVCNQLQKLQGNGSGGGRGNY